ncbi:MAG TPA: PEP/pyruvate-binding domain-containing protein, partial [Pseudonocardia sp.]
MCGRAAGAVRTAGLPAGLAEAVRAAYVALSGEDDEGVVVAVRSSAVGEDGADTSFAGMNATFTNVRGAEALFERIVDCWASLFGPRVVAYRAARGSSAEPAIAVVAQVMVDAQRSGVAFTADPATGRRDRVVVEAALGQGEVVVSGAVEPDTYQLSASDARLVAARVRNQTHEIVRGTDGADQTVRLDPLRAGARVLSDDEAADVARLA